MPILDICHRDKVLIVAPHPDDESIGCGGLLSLYGPQCDILLLTDGRMGHNYGDNVNEDELVEIREEEFLQAVKAAGVRNLRTLRIHDQTLALNKKEVASFNITGYDYIFIPNRHEFNLDHKAVYPIIKEMMHKQKSRARLLEYEVWSPVNRPNQWIEMDDDIINKKLQLISNYKSQIAMKDYVSIAVGLATYRGVFFKTKYAEAYYEEVKESLLISAYRIIPYRVRWNIRNFIKKRSTDRSIAYKNRRENYK